MEGGKRQREGEESNTLKKKVWVGGENKEERWTVREKKMQKEIEAE